MNKTKQQFYLRTAKIVTLFTLGCLMFNDTSRDRIMYRQNSFIPKMTFSFFAVVFIDRYGAEIKHRIKKLKDFERTKLAFRLWEFHTIDWIPARKLLHILMDHKSLKYEIFNRYISSERNLYSKLTGNLERVGILTRGEKNSKILNSVFNEEQIYSILCSASDSDSLSPTLQQTWECSYEVVR